MNAASTSLNFLFPLITFPYVSRILDPTGYGAAEFALSTAQLFSLVALLGVNTYGVRECARIRDNKMALSGIFQELMLILGVWSIVVTAAYYVIIGIVPRFSESFDLFIWAGLLIPLSTLGVQWYLGANEQYAFMAGRNLAVKLVVVVCMFLFVRTAGDVVVWVVISVASTGLVSMANAVFVLRNVERQPWYSLNWKRHIKPLVIFFLMVASIGIYTMLDSVMLGYMTDDAQVGYYGVAVKIKNVFTAIIGALSGVLVPRTTYYLAQGDRDAFSRSVNLSVRAAFIYASFSVTAVLLFAEPVILLLAGQDYAPAIIALQAIMPAVVFISFTQVTANEVLTPLNREWALAIGYGVGGFVDIALNLLLIPMWGALGAGVATTVTEMLIFLMQFVLVVRITGLRMFMRGCARPLPAILIAICIMIGGRVIFGAGSVAAVGSVAAAAVALLGGLLIVEEPLIADVMGSAKRMVKKRR